MKMAWPILIIAFGAALDLAAKLWARASLEPYGAATEFLPFVALRLTFNHRRLFHRGRGARQCH
jgi:signal peptidase II